MEYSSFSRQIMPFEYACSIFYLKMNFLKTYLCRTNVAAVGSSVVNEYFRKQKKREIFPTTHAFLFQITVIMSHNEYELL